MAGKIWTLKEDEILKELYKESETKLICDAISNRSWNAIKIRADKFGLVRWNIPQKKADLRVLLEDNPIS